MARQDSTGSIRRMRGVALLLAACAAGGLAAADPARWYKAKRIDYEIVAVHSGWASIGPGGEAQISDRIEFTVSTDLAGTIVKPLEFKNFPSAVSDLRSLGRGCLAPVLEGPLELLTVERIDTPANSTAAGAIMHFRVDYPKMQVSKFCTSRATQDARTERQAEPFHVPTVGEYLVNPAAYRGTGITVDEPKGTMVMSPNPKMPGGWTWTVKATPR